jgi:hypothetical protein
VRRRARGGGLDLPWFMAFMAIYTMFPVLDRPYRAFPVVSGVRSGPCRAFYGRRQHHHMRISLRVRVEGEGGQGDGGVSASPGTLSHPPTPFSECKATPGPLPGPGGHVDASGGPWAPSDRPWRVEGSQTEPRREPQPQRQSRQGERDGRGRADPFNLSVEWRIGVL